MTTAYLSTIDNPFHPVTQFDDWLAFDEQAGYFSLELLARVVQVDDELSDSEYNEAVDKAIDEVLAWDETGKRCKVMYDDSESD